MLVIVTNKEDYTADYLILEIRKRGAEYLRFNTEDFPSKIAISWEISREGVDGHLQIRDKKLNFANITSIWFRRPVLPVPEALVTDSVDRKFIVQESVELLEGIWRTLDCFWVSRPDALRAAESKLLQLKKAHMLDFNISPTIVTNLPELARNFIASSPSIYKPLDRARIERSDSVGLLFTSLVGDFEASFLDQVRLSPSLFQNFLTKRADIRVTVIGVQVFAVEILAEEPEQIRYDWRRVTPSQLRFVYHELPEELEKKCRQLVLAMGLQFGAIDLIQTASGEYFFLEINPNGQWAWIQQMNPEIKLREALADLLISDRSGFQI